MFSHYLFFSLISFLIVSHISAALNGDVVDESEFRYQAAILDISKGGPKLICGGAIIQRRYILTSAHCVNEYKSQDLVVRTGGDEEPDPSKPHEGTRTFHKVIKIYLHAEYNSAPCRRHQHDIAILKIKPNFDLSKAIHYTTVDLPDYDDDDYEGVSAVFSGHGPDYVAESNSAQPDGLENKTLRYDYLRSLPVTVLSNEECQTKVDVILTESSLCIESIKPGGHTCFEDAGGPLVHDGKIIGILNNNNCNPDKPEIFTRVSSYLPFINNVLKHQFSYDILIR